MKRQRTTQGFCNDDMLFLKRKEALAIFLHLATISLHYGYLSVFILKLWKNYALMIFKLPL